VSPYISLRFPTGRPGSKLNAGDLVGSLTEEFRKGSLPAGSRLPPLRTIAHQLGISKNTFHAASLGNRT
jgi:DNA-binding FadR family transcriptional regulator